MAVMIARAFGCRVIIKPGCTGVLANIVYIGVKQNAQLAEYTHSVFQRQVVKGREAYLKTQPSWLSRGEKMAAGETFCRGYIANVNAKVSAMTLEPEVKEALDAKFAAKYPVLRAHKAPARGFNSDAYAAGHEAGKGASLNRPVNGGTANLALPR